VHHRHDLTSFVAHDDSEPLEPTRDLRVKIQARHSSPFTAHSQHTAVAAHVAIQIMMIEQDPENLACDTALLAASLCMTR
jgi:hypothetical protein